MNKQRIRFAALILTMAWLTQPVMAIAQFPDIGGLIKGVDSVKKLGDSFRKITQEEEVKLGGDLAGLILGAAPLVRDQRKQAYVNRLGRWLALHSERPDLPWKFGIIDTDDVNAFSMPGGYILITRGMFDQMRNESELAGVLAHEIAHVERRHHLAALQKSLRNASLSEFTDYMKVGGGGLGSAFTKALVSAGMDLYSRGLDKQDEFEADRMGVVIAARSGYSPYGLAGVLQTLSAAPDEEGFALMNRTHPLPVDRIIQLDSAMGTRLDSIEGLIEDLPGFAHLRTPPPAPQPAPSGKKGKRNRGG